MKYFHEIHGVQLCRDVYAEQFADPGDIKTRYWVAFHDECLAEGEDPQKLAKELTAVAARLSKVAKFLASKARK